MPLPFDRYQRKVEESHPGWLDPEMAKLLDQNGFRRRAKSDAYFGPDGSRITEVQLLVRDVESLRMLIAIARKRLDKEPPEKS